MNIVQQVLDFLKTLLQWWFIVEPWEQAVRVRLGKRVQLFEGGAHFRLPFFDTVYLQNIRRRLISMGSQTVTTKDLKLVTVHSTLGFTITDILCLQQTLHDAEGTVMQHVTARLAKDIASHDLVDCAAAQLMDRVGGALGLEQYGLGNLEFALTSYVANIRTLRVINDLSAPWMGGMPLNTICTLATAKEPAAAMSGR